MNVVIVPQGAVSSVRQPPFFSKDCSGSVSFVLDLSKDWNRDAMEAGKGVSIAAGMIKRMAGKGQPNGVPVVSTLLLLELSAEQILII